MSGLQLGSPQALPALAAAAVGFAFVLGVRARRRGRNPRAYDPALAWLRACAYFSFAWALALLTGALSTIVDNPVVFPGQTSDVWWWVFTLASLAVVVIGYWVIWPIGTRAHGRRIVLPDTPAFGVLWGVSEGLIFASVWTTAVRVFGRADTVQRLEVFVACYLVLSLFIGLWHAIYWDLYIAPEHNVLEWNIRKVILCHNPNVIVTTAYVTVFANLTLYVGLQAVALFGATLAMPFPSFRYPNPETDPDAPPRRDVRGLVCVVTGIGRSFVADAAVDLADAGAALVLIHPGDAGDALAQRIRAWVENADVSVLRSDMESDEGLRAVLDEVQLRWGGADVVIDVADPGESADPVTRFRWGRRLQLGLSGMAGNARPLRVIVDGSEDHRRASEQDLDALLQARDADPASLAAARVALVLSDGGEPPAPGLAAHAAVTGAMVGNAAAEPGGPAAFFSTIFQSNEDPARTYTHLAWAAELSPASGGYWMNSAPATPSELVQDVDVRRRVRAWSTGST